MLYVFSGAKMLWRSVVLWQMSSLVLISGTLDIKFFSQKQPYTNTQANCFELPKSAANGISKTVNEGWPAHNRVIRNIIGSEIIPKSMSINIHKVLPRIDRWNPASEDIVKEHAKLVQDINSLRQVVFIAPFIDDSKDYEDSIFPEIIETSTTTTPKPLKLPVKQGSIPLILVGGESQRQAIKSQPIKLLKPTISLVGTSVSPLMKHPYPFVIQTSPRKPLRVCMTSLPMYTTTRRPTLWERLLNSIIPR